MTEQRHSWAQAAVALCAEASEAILAVYHQPDFGIQTKDDESPVTKADIAASKIITAGLTAATPDIPIICEELPLPPFAERQHWSRYWLVDPLDGTKEFIGRNDQFTVNIALIEQGVAIVGVVYVPVTHTAYLGILGEGAYKQQHGKTEPIACRTLPSRTGADSLRVVASKHHRNEATNTFIDALGAHWPNMDMHATGSSLKFCLLAEGAADVYPRFAPTSEWDTAAAQAVLEAAGGAVYRENHSPLRYNTKDSILNPYFYAVADIDFGWRKLISPAP